VNKLVLTHISALVGFLRKIVKSVHRYGQYEVRYAVNEKTELYS